jgi:hypothetical protein
MPMARARPRYPVGAALLQPTVRAGSRRSTTTRRHLPLHGFTINTNYPIGDVRRYSIVPNASETPTKTTNTTLMLALISARATDYFTGDIWFTNTTGADIYYFSDILDFRDNIHVHLCGSTIQFNKSTTDAHDLGAGFISAIRNFVLEDGFVVINYTGGANNGAIMAFGARGNDFGGALLLAARAHQCDAMTKASIDLHTDIAGQLEMP